MATKTGALLFLWACTVGGAQASGVKTEVSTIYTTEQKQHVWRYTITWTGRLREEINATISFRVPEDYANPNIVTPERELLRSEGLDGFWEWVFPVSESEGRCQRKQVTMTFAGPTSVLKNSLIRWQSEYNSLSSGKGMISGPELKRPQPRFRIVLGGGAAIGGNDFIEFKDPDENKSFLFLANDSRVRASAIIGAAFRINTTGGPWDVITSLQFTTPTERYVDGFFVGLSYGIHDYLSIGGGYSLHVGKELSYGFQRAAARFVRESGRADQFPIGPDGTRLRSQKDYDGLPLTNSKGERWFEGNPIVDSSHHSIFIGLFVPVDVPAAIRKVMGLPTGE